MVVFYPDQELAMNLNYLDFEQPIAELEGKIEELQLVGNSSDVNIADEIAKLREKSTKLTETIYSKLTAWDIVKESNRLVDSVLMLEKQLNNSFSKYQKYAFIERNNILIRTYSDEYANAYHQLLNGMVERRMTGAIQQVGAFWYSAWVEAGQPNLKNIGKVTIDEAPINTKNKKNMGREEL